MSSAATSGAPSSTPSGAPSAEASGASSASERSESPVYERVLPVGPQLFRAVSASDIEKILSLHIRRCRAPLLDVGAAGLAQSPDLDLSNMHTIPHFVRNGELVVDMRKRVVLILQLKYRNEKLESMPLFGERFLEGRKMKLMLAPEDCPSETFVSKRHRAAGFPIVQTSEENIFSGSTDPTGSYAIAAFDEDGCARFEFRILLLSARLDGRPAKSRFFLKASPLDAVLHCPQLTWKSVHPFSVKSQIRARNS